MRGFAVLEFVGFLLIVYGLIWGMAVNYESPGAGLTFIVGCITFVLGRFR
jgi:hypothetical protein